MLRNPRRYGVLVLAAALLVGCGGGGGDDENVPSQFAYDDSKALEVVTRPTSYGTFEVRVEDVSFSGPSNTRLSGFLLTPSNTDGRHPAVIYAHGARGNRQELLDQAMQMAEQGTVALTLNMIYSPERARPLPQGLEGVEANSELEAEAVREVRRSVDFLESLDSVEEDEIGYVGWSQGARMGALISGVEHRIKAFDLIAGGAAPVSEYVKYAPPDLKDELTTILERTDPIHFVGLAEPSELLFQDGRQDDVVPEPALEALAEAGSEPKEVRWYQAGHVPSERMWAESRTWLSDHLGLTEEST